MDEGVVIIGGSSPIARALAYELGKNGRPLIIAGRNENDLNKIAADLHIRSRIDVGVERLDALDFADHDGFVRRCIDRFHGSLGGVVVCYGFKPEQATAERDISVALRAIDVNFSSVVSLLNRFANYFEERKHGYIAAISSVAGDRGRQSNYIYGSAKAGLTAYLQGLRNRLHCAGAHVLTIKPGYVDTPMTYGMFSEHFFLVASPVKVARDIEKALRQKKHVIYSAWFWWGIMKIVKCIPETIFKRLRL